MSVNKRTSYVMPGRNKDETECFGPWRHCHGILRTEQHVVISRALAYVISSLCAIQSANYAHKDASKVA
jgi:hypothetical protein